jgi:hypothetical protein
MCYIDASLRHFNSPTRVLLKERLRERAQMAEEYGLEAHSPSGLEPKVLGDLRQRSYAVHTGCPNIADSTPNSLLPRLHMMAHALPLGCMLEAIGRIGHVKLRGCWCRDA